MLKQTVYITMGVMLLVGTAVAKDKALPPKARNILDKIETFKIIHDNGGPTMNCQLTLLNVIREDCPQPMLKVPKPGPTHPPGQPRKSNFVAQGAPQGNFSQSIHIEIVGPKPDLKPLRQDIIKYPRSAYEGGISGRVEVLAKIEDGEVKHIDYVRKAGNGFDKAVSESLKKWRYRPDVNATIHLAVEFKAPTR